MKSSRVFGLYFTVIAVLFFCAFAGRIANFQPQLTNDDGHYLRVALNIISGQWLGHYGKLTLATGPGFPLFLVLARYLGLTYLAAYALAYSGAVYFFSETISKITSGRALRYVLPAALFLLPVLADNSTAQVQRNLLAAVLAMIAISGFLRVAFLRSSPINIAIGGLSVGALWITREDSIWIILPITVIAVLAFARAREFKALAPFIVAGAIALLPIGAVISMNAAEYGQPLVNDQTSGAFASAMKALRSAAAPYSRTYVSIPKEARAAIYAVSPTFAKLKPSLDPDTGVNVWGQFGCAQNATVCGDIGAWFRWAFRDAVVGIGGYTSPQKADAIYGAIAREINEACSDGSLACQYWPVPIIPPVHLAQIKDILKGVWRVSRVVLFRSPINTSVPASHIDDGLERGLYEFVGSPRARTAKQITSISGWFRSHGDAWFEASNAQVERYDSPDIAAAFNDPQSSRQRFTIIVKCSKAECPFEVNGRTFNASAVTPGSDIPVEVGKMHIDVVHHARRNVQANIIALSWLDLSAFLAPLFSLLFVGGALSLVFILYRDYRCGRLFPSSAVCIILWVALLGRAVILVLADGLSFNAATYSYALPIFPLLTAAATVSVMRATRFIGD